VSLRGQREMYWVEGSIRYQATDASLRLKAVEVLLKRSEK